MSELAPVTGIRNRKLAMWTFIGSECMLFATLISTYMVYRGRNLIGPYPHELLNVPFITVTTFVLLMSSLCMVLALAAMQQGNRRQARFRLFLTAALGLVFLVGQFYEFNHFHHEGLGLSRNLFSSTFYILTGTHGAHVLGGVIWLSTLFLRLGSGPIDAERIETVEIAGLYWHFVDAVWIILFTLIYLLA